MCLPHKHRSDGSIKIAVIGSRDFPDKQAVVDFVNSLPMETLVISGGARGVDRWAAAAAWMRGMATQVIPAKWKLFGKKAGTIRNGKIVEQADRIVAFWDGESPGTKDAIDQARALGKDVQVKWAMGKGPNDGAL